MQIGKNIIKEKIKKINFKDKKIINNASINLKNKKMIFLELKEKY